MLSKRHTNALGGASSRLRSTKKARAIRPRARGAKPGVEPLALGPATSEGGERRARLRRHFVPHSACEDEDEAPAGDDGFGQVASLHSVVQLMKLYGFPK